MKSNEKMMTDSLESGTADSLRVARFFSKQEMFIFVEENERKNSQISEHLYMVHMTGHKHWLKLPLYDDLL